MCADVRSGHGAVPALRRRRVELFEDAFDNGGIAVVDEATISLPLAFAAGAVIASLADTLMPEAYEHGGAAVAMSTAAGFVLSFVLSLA
jgi:zinc transporter ZupT